MRQVNITVPLSGKQRASRPGVEPEMTFWNQSNEPVRECLLNGPLPVTVPPMAALVVWPDGRWVMWSLESSASQAPRGRYNYRMG